MNSHQRRAQRRAVERGFGPRHAFNAQEGSEAVPSRLPDPPEEDLQFKRNSLGNLRPAKLLRALGDELGGLSKEDVAKLGISLLIGGEGPSPRGAAGNGAVPMKMWNSWKTVKPGDAAGGEIRVDHAGNHYQELGSHLDTKAGYENPSEGGYHAIVRPVEAPGDANSQLRKLVDGGDWDSGAYAKDQLKGGLSGGKKPDEQFPSLNKPPYDALKELGPLTPEEQAAADFAEKNPHHKVGDAEKKEFLEAMGETGPGDEWKADSLLDQLKKLQKEFPPDKIQNDEPKDPSFPAEDVQKMEDLKDFLKPPKGGPPAFPPSKFQADWMTRQDRGIPHPGEEPPADDWTAPPRFKKGTKGVRHNPRTKTGRPKKIGVERGYGPRHAANAKEGEDLTAVNTDTVPAMLTPREAVLNRNAAELAGRDDIEALNAEGNQLAQQGIDLAGKDKNMKPKQSKLKSGSPYAQGFEKLQVGGPVRPVPKPGGMPVPAARPGSAGLGDVPPMPPAQVPPGYGTPPQPGLGNSGGQPFPGRGEGGVYPSMPSLGSAGGDEGMPGLQTPTPGLAWQHKRNMAPQGPGLDWQRKRNAAIAAGQDQPAMPPGAYHLGGGPYGEPPGTGLGGPQWKPYGGVTNQPAPGLYPPGKGIFHGATGSTDIEPIGDPNQQQVYGPPIQLSAPDISKLIQQEGQKQGLNPNQIAALTKAFSSFGGGGGYANQSLSAGEDFGNPNYIGLGTPSYQGGISEVGYPPGIAPRAAFSYDEGGWTGPLDPRWSSPGYQFGTSWT